MGGQSNVYAYVVNDLFLTTSFTYLRDVGGQKSPRICLRSYWIAQYINLTQHNILDMYVSYLKIYGFLQENKKKTKKIHSVTT